MHIRGRLIYISQGTESLPANAENPFFTYIQKVHMDHPDKPGDDCYAQPFTKMPKQGDGKVEIKLLSP